MSGPTYSHGLPDILCDFILPLGHVDWKSWHVLQFFLQLAFMLIQYMDSHVNSLFFSILIRLRCRCFCALSCSDADTINPVPFMAILCSNSSLNDQCHCSSLCTLPLLTTSHNVHTLREYLGVCYFVLPILFLFCHVARYVHACLYCIDDDAQD